MRLKDKLNRIVNNLRVSTGYNYKNKNSFNYRKQLNRIIICIFIIFIIMILKKIDFNFSNDVIRIVKDTLNYNYDVREDTLGILNYVKNKIADSEGIISVFKSGISIKENISLFRFFI